MKDEIRMAAIDIYCTGDYCLMWDYLREQISNGNINQDEADEIAESAVKNDEVNETIFRVIGTDDLEGTIFCYCSTYEKAVKAADLLQENGFDGLVDIVQDEFILNKIEIGDELIEL